jgi:hypothetical protein
MLAPHFLNFTLILSSNLRIGLQHTYSPTKGKKLHILLTMQLLPSNEKKARQLPRPTCTVQAENIGMIRARLLSWPLVYWILLCPYMNSRIVKVNQFYPQLPRLLFDGGQ